MASKNETPWAMNQPTHWTQPDGSKDPKTRHFASCFAAVFFSAELGLSEEDVQQRLESSDLLSLVLKWPFFLRVVHFVFAN